ncbi:hypothetical protein TNCV_5113171 [Trichonephila clavipes]|nr:hypothetical protein TNCV_5113171 [Trichonephila clavipes]
MRSACDQSTLPIDVQVFHCKARDPHVEAWRVGCHLSCPSRHSTEVPNHTVYERRVRYKPLPLQILLSPDTGETKKSLSSSVDLPFP